MLRPSVRRRVLASGLVVHAGIPFDGVAARVLRALKEQGRTGLARSLAPALAAALAAAADAPDAPSAGEGWTVVPVPTSRASMRRRGFRVVELIAGRAGVRVTPLLRNVRQTSDQRGLDVAARERNVAASMRARVATGLSVILVDDVVTTGATLREAERALRAAGAARVVAATVAATPRLQASSGPASAP